MEQLLPPLIHCLKFPSSSTIICKLHLFDDVSQAVNKWLGAKSTSTSGNIVSLSETFTALDDHSLTVSYIEVCWLHVDVLKVFGKPWANILHVVGSSSPVESVECVGSIH